MGARPLRRTIQHLVEDQLSEKILFGEIVPGSTIHVSVEGEGETAKLSFRSEKKQDGPDAVEAAPAREAIESPAGSDPAQDQHST